MPGKRKRQGKGARRRSLLRRSRRKNYSKRASAIVRLPEPNGMPNQMRCGLVYSDLAETLATGVGTGIGHTYYRLSMNDCADPDETAAGAQPPLFDNLSAIYQKWRVNSVKVTVNIENYTNFPTYVTLVGVFDPTTNSPSSPTNPAIYDLMALPVWQRSQRKRVSTVQVGDKNQVSISKRFYPKDIVGQNYFSSVNFTGEGSSSPAKIIFIDIIAQTGAPAANTPNIGLWMSYTLEYDVTFFNQNVLETATYD